MCLDNPHRFSVLATKSETGSPDQNVSTSAFENCGRTTMDMPECKEMTKQIQLAGKATLTSGLLLGRSGALRSFRHYLRARSQGHHSIDHMC